MIKEKIANLIDLKSILTIALIGAVIFFVGDGKLDPTSIKDFALMVLTYYFGKNQGSTTTTVTQVTSGSTTEENLDSGKGTEDIG